MTKEDTSLQFVTEIGTFGDLEIKDPTTMEILKEAEENGEDISEVAKKILEGCLLYTSPSPRD